MLTIPNSGAGFARCLGLAAVGTLLLAAAPIPRAEALTLVSPATSPVVKTASGGMITEVFGRGGGVHLGGGGGGSFHAAPMGGFRGGPVGGFRGGPVSGFRTGPAIYGGHVGAYRYGGYRLGGYHYGGYPYWHRHHRFYRRFYGGFYYPYYYSDYYYYPYRRCRIIWTYYGPRRVCHWPRWGWPYSYYW